MDDTKIFNISLYFLYYDGYFSSLRNRSIINGYYFSGDVILYWQKQKMTDYTTKNPYKFILLSKPLQQRNLNIYINFFLITSTNLIGLYIYNQYVLLTSLILVLIRLVLILWIFSYRRYLNRGCNYLANTLIVNIIYPSLSLLLRNIEILTHMFRPVTLIARIWVNMWVGHCILSILSFIYIKRFSAGFGS